MVLGTLIDDLMAEVGIAPNAILPSQIPRSHGTTAEMRLYFAVLEDALRIYSCKGAKRKPAVRLDVIEWFFDDGGSGPFSFRGICENLGIEVSAFRERIRTNTVGTPMRRQAIKVRAA